MPNVHSLIDECICVRAKQSDVFSRTSQCRKLAQGNCAKHSAGIETDPNQVQAATL